MDLEMFKVLATGGSGLVVAGVVMFYSDQQRRADAASRLRDADDYAARLLTINERLEHVVNSTRMERQTSQAEMLGVIKDVSGVIARNTAAVDDLKEWVRKQ